MSCQVSIIIPTFNRATLIGATLQRIQEQTFTSWECLIVDDGSTDTTLETVGRFIAQDSRFVLYSRPESLLKGSNSCRNFGFEKAQGAWVHFFDSDDVLEPTFYETLLTGDLAGIHMVAGSYFVTDSHLQKREAVSLTLKSTLFRDYVLWRLKLITGCVVFRKSFLDVQTFPLFHADLHRGQETELFSRLFFSLEPSAYRLYDFPLFLYRQHSDSKSAQHQSYLPHFKQSQFWVLQQTIALSQPLQDSELNRHFFNTLTVLFFDAVTHRDLALAPPVLRELISLLKSYSFVKSLEVFVLGHLVLWFQRPVFRLRKRWLHFYPDTHEK